MDKLSYDVNHVYREGYNDAFWDFYTMVEKALDKQVDKYGCSCIESYCDAFFDINDKMEVLLHELKLLQPKEN